MDQTSLETKVVTTATDFDTLQRGSYSDKETSDTSPSCQTKVGGHGIIVQ